MIDQLERLARLHDSGALTDQEYEDAKLAVIGAASRGELQLMPVPSSAPPSTPRWPMLLVLLAIIAGIATALWLTGALHFG